MSEQSVARILQDLNAAYLATDEKTASAASPKKKKKPPMGHGRGASVAKKAALEESLYHLNAASSEKVASHGNDSAVDALEKMANDLAAADMAATVKEAHTFGAAVFDGFINRANAYAGGNVANTHTKTASYAMREKIAHQQYHSGAVQAVAEIAAASGECFERGMQHAAALLR